MGFLRRGQSARLPTNRVSWRVPKAPPSWGPGQSPSHQKVFLHSRVARQRLVITFCHVTDFSVPWLFLIFPDYSRTTMEFPDFSRLSRWVTNLYYIRHSITLWLPFQTLTVTPRSQSLWRLFEVKFKKPMAGFPHKWQNGRTFQHYKYQKITTCWLGLPSHLVVSYLYHNNSYPSYMVHNVKWFAGLF